MQGKQHPATTEGMLERTCGGGRGGGGREGGGRGGRGDSCKHFHLLEVDNATCSGQSDEHVAPCDSWLNVAPVIQQGDRACISVE
eukprot:6077937-Pyramimonas_sp.AAC.1